VWPINGLGMKFVRYRDRTSTYLGMLKGEKVAVINRMTVPLSVAS